MLFPFLNLSIAILLPSALLMVMFITAQRSDDNQEKSSPFECGFDPKNTARLPFSLRFFLLAVIFLVFDIEIALLMPIPIALNFMMTNPLLLGNMMFVLILLLGLLHEWHEGSLDWTN